jgi:hypothetical protein
MELLGTQEFARLSGVSMNVVGHMRRAGLRPFRHGHGGTGSVGDLWTIGQALAVRVARLCRERGGTVNACDALRQAMWKHDEATLAKVFATGRKYVVLVRGQIFPGLLAFEEVTPLQEKAAAGGVSATTVDVERVLAIMRGALAESRCTTEPARAGQSRAPDPVP